jgi:hypothetical protein
VAVVGALLLGPPDRPGAWRWLVLLLGAGAWCVLLVQATSLPAALVPGLLLALGGAARRPSTSA